MTAKRILAGAILALYPALSLAQGSKPAATVNGQPIPQIAVERALERFDESERAKARAEILDFLIDNVLIDQYLAKQKIVIERQEIETRLAEIKKEIEKSGQTFEKVLTSLKMTEAEFLEQVTNDLRWEKFAETQATDERLRQMFEQHRDMFDGSMVRARHILLTAGNDPASQDAARNQLMHWRQQIEAKAAAAMAKLPKNVDDITREEERQKQLEQAFADVAKERSACPSKRDGGDVNWFPRAGHMVEPFAKAAFALKPFEISEPVQTQFGWHLILCTGKKNGQSVKYEDVKDEVRDIFCGRLREEIAAKLRQTAQIVIHDTK